MKRLVLCTLFAAGLVASALLTDSAVGQPQGIQRGKVKSIDLDRLLITLTVEDSDHTYALTEDTKVLGATGKNLKKNLERLKPGTELMFKVEKRGGKDVIVGLRPAGGAPAQPKVDVAKLKPLPELGADKYQGFQGGFYPGGKNTRPDAHESAGVALAKQVQPLGPDGKPGPDGKIVLLSVGMSNTSQASQGFQKALNGFDNKNPRLMFVNGAQGGMTAAAIQDPDSNSGSKYWTTVDDRLKKAGVTLAQVQVVWIKQADAGPSQGFPKYAEKLQAELTKIVQLLPQRFPNVKLVYLSSRTGAAYAKTPLNPEPYAYESGFSVKWLIEKQITGDPALNHDPKKGEVKAPWLSWGAYLWAAGANKRADGFHYLESDFVNDGTHLSPSGQQKVGELLLQFFKTDTTTRPWFVSAP
jgi:hypothetical protein